MRAPASPAFPARGGVALLGGLLACLAAIGPAAAGGPVTGTHELAPFVGALHTPPSALAAGDRLAWRWNATPGDAILRFSVHLHEAGHEVVLRTFNASSSEDGHVAARAGHYALLWQNEGEGDVILSYAWELEPGPPSKAAPGPGGAALAALVLAMAMALAPLRRRRP